MANPVQPNQVSQAHLLTAVEKSANLVMITDPAGVILYVNPRFCAVTGYAPHEAIGQTPALLKSGRQGDAYYRNLWTTIRAGGVWSGELDNRRRDGAIITVRATITPISDDSGRISHFLAVQEDVTQLREIERERQVLRARLDESARVAELGMMVSVVTHEIRSPLTVGLGWARLARRDLEKTDLDPRALDEKLARVEEALKQIQGIVVRIRMTANGGREAARERVAIHPLVQSLSGLMAGIFNDQGVRLVLELTADRDVVLGDEGEFQQVLINLLNNARDAILGLGRGGTILIRTELVHDMLCIKVKDDGPGIDAALQERIFETFFTTKTAGKGTGMGLGIARQIVDRMEGALTVESRPGFGATFVIQLPLAAQGSSAA